KQKKNEIILNYILCKRFHGGMIQIINYWKHASESFHFLFTTLCKRLHKNQKGEFGMKDFKFSKGLVASLMLSAAVLAGCSSDGEEASGSGSEDQVTVDIFQFKVEFKDQFEDVVALYEKENP